MHICNINNDLHKESSAAELVKLFRQIPNTWFIVGEFIENNIISGYFITNLKENSPALQQVWDMENVPYFK